MRTALMLKDDDQVLETPDQIKIEKTASTPKLQPKEEMACCQATD